MEKSDQDFINELNIKLRNRFLKIFYTIRNVGLLLLVISIIYRYFIK